MPNHDFSVDTQSEKWISLSCHYHYFPSSSIERDGWRRSIDVLVAIWDHVFLNMVMLCMLVLHCVLKADKKFDLHFWSVLPLALCDLAAETHCFWGVLRFCSVFLIVWISGSSYLQYLGSHWSHLTSFNQTHSLDCLVCLRKCHTDLAP